MPERPLDLRLAAPVVALWAGAWLAPLIAARIVLVGAVVLGLTLALSHPIEELTQGRYKVQVFCCSQLGNDPKNIEQVALGGIDFTVSGTGSYAGQVPTLNLTMMPFIIDFGCSEVGEMY